MACRNSTKRWMIWLSVLLYHIPRHVCGDSFTLHVSENVRLQVTEDQLFKLDGTNITAADRDKLARLHLSLHLALYRSGVLPRDGVFSYRKNGAMISSIPRYSIREFITNVTGLVRPGSRCLEWGVGYINSFKNCSEKWSFEYAATSRVDSAKRVIYGKVDVMLHENLRQMAGTFDVIVCTQVFEHIRYPHVAAVVLEALLANEGLLFWSAPFMEPVHFVPEDHYRYTLLGAETLLKNVGLHIHRSFIGGNGMLATARLLGYTYEDFDEEARRGILIDSTEYAAMKVPVKDAIYWGTYLVAQKLVAYGTSDNSSA